MTLPVQPDQTPDRAQNRAQDRALASVAPSPARDRASRNVGGLTRLFAERPELRGVHAPADLADDAVRWSA